jgi:hypothetical protein
MFALLKISGSTFSNFWGIFDKICPLPKTVLENESIQLNPSARTRLILSNILQSFWLKIVLAYQAQIEVKMKNSI